MRFGIDFGTTRTVVAVSDRGNYPVVSFADGAGGSREWFPSVVAERDGELVFGFDALARDHAPGWTVVRSFKRLLGGPGTMPSTTVRLGASEHAVVDVLEGFLRAVAEAVRHASNLPPEDAPLEVVMATPAHALGPQRFVTIDAFRRAGFELLGFLDEPSAAGFEYTHRHRRTLTSNRQHVLVYDLGGGTFDAALVHLADLRHEVVTTGGDARVGGDDFDIVLVQRVLDDLGTTEAALGTKRSLTLRERAREAKEALNPNSRRVTVDLGDLDLGAPVHTLPVADYYAACRPWVERTLAAMAPVLEAAEQHPIAGLYVVGGGSALPVVGRRLREDLGRRVHRSPYPSGAVAIGLAIAADETAGFEVEGRLSRFFGVFRELDGGNDVAFDPIFGRDEPIPATAQARS
ncbi:MAG: Hsp70 family protein, partial [Myxococcota bacterium]